MENDPKFEQIRKEIEAKQRAILWPDGLNAGKSVDEFLWKGDPNAKPVQRAGLIVFAVTFWFFGCFMIAASWASKEDAWFAFLLGTLVGLAFILVAIRLFRNAFLRQNNTDNEKDDFEE
jgi:hypothetical protein